MAAQGIPLDTYAYTYAYLEGHIQNLGISNLSKIKAMKKNKTCELNIIFALLNPIGVQDFLFVLPKI